MSVSSAFSCAVSVAWQLVESNTKLAKEQQLPRLSHSMLATAPGNSFCEMGAASSCDLQPPKTAHNAITPNQPITRLAMKHLQKILQSYTKASYRRKPESLASAALARRRRRAAALAAE